MEQETVYRQAVQAAVGAKKEAPGLSGAPGHFSGGFDEMEQVYKEQHEHSNVRKKAKITS